MAYEKRICVLKQIKKGFSADGSALSGVVYAERLGGELTVTPRVAGLSPVKEGRYVLCLWADGQTYCLELQGGASLKIADAPSVKGGFAALLCFVRGGAEPIAFAHCGAAPARWQPLLEAVSGEKNAKMPAVPLPPTELPVPASPNVPRAPTPPVPDPAKEADGVATESTSPREERAAARCEGYDDEAIAAENYFRGAGNGGGDEDEKTAPLQEEAGAAAPDAPPPDESDLLSRPRGSLTYFYEVKEKLDEAFKKYPRDNSLLEAFPYSEWVKTESALLGIVCEAGVPRYLCVAVAAGKEPPPAMGEKAAFVPQSAFSEEEGFWVVFQDADTGEYVTVSAED